MDVDPRSWAELEFGECELGDERRTRRLIEAASQTLARPDGSTPEQTEVWADCKAFYRLMDCDDFGHEEITAPHIARTRASGAEGQVLLLLNDTTEINYGGKRRAKGLGLVGHNTGRGFFLHTALMRDPDTGEVIGVAGHDIYYRHTPKKRGAKNSRRRDPQRESTVWGRLIDRVGSPPAGVRWLHVCDRGADDYEVYLHARLQGCGWVIRAARLNRRVENQAGETLSLEGHIRSQPRRGRCSLDVAATDKRPARTAELELRFARVSLPKPQVTNAWIRQHAPKTSLAMWVVELIEIEPPAGAEPVQWVLLTSEEITSVEQARRVIDHYSQRWAVEEYHKALKTGCRVESRQYETAARLERVTGLLSIVAVQLLRMRYLSQHAPNRPAIEAVPAEWVDVLSQVRRIKPGQSLTIEQFVRHLAGLGGHLGRKCDGQPGWITLWRGLEKLLLILRGFRAARKRCG
ncbi:MAG: IS4 family transposase [Actinomycetales bacterium]|nr:IS4 family transposase [Actinomycetales bacterium]